jgi:hypothetical protein
MLGAAGFIIPEAFNKFGANCGPEAVWFKVCNSLLVFSMTVVDFSCLGINLDRKLSLYYTRV